MLSPQFAAPLIIDITPSRRVRGLIIAVTVATALFVLALPFYSWQKALLFTFVVGYGLRTLWQLTRPKSGVDVIRVVWDEAGLWWTLRANGDRVEARLQNSTYIQPFVVILQLKCVESKQRFSHILTHDNCDADALRRLRVRLRHEPTSSEDLL